MLGQMKEIVEILKGIKDEASAKAAKPKLEAMRKEVRRDESRGRQDASTLGRSQKKNSRKSSSPQLEKLRGEL